jgi:hypothetical protein
MLPSAWIDRVFSKLTVRYGARFLSLYSGVDLNAVKADWAEHLSGFSGERGRCLAFALDNLPDEAPNVAQFRALCNRAPEPAVKMLPGPKPDMQRVNAEVAKLRTVSRTEHGPKAWAWRLKAREEQGDRLGPYQRRAWREALQAELQTEQA